jgi:hypothetical protein
MSMIVSFIALLVSLAVLSSDEKFRASGRVLFATFLHGLAGCLMFIAVILFGIYGKRRDWMMNWQFNWFGWSYHLAIVSCVLHLLTAFIAGYQSANK